MPHYKDSENKLHFLDDATFEHLLPDGCIEISSEEAAAITASLVPVPTYAELRAAEYPSIPDQLDTLYHGGLDAWRSEIEAVKLKYPKP